MVWPAVWALVAACSGGGAVPGEPHASDDGPSDSGVGGGQPGDSGSCDGAHCADTDAGTADDAGIVPGSADPLAPLVERIEELEETLACSSSIGAVCDLDAAAVVADALKSLIVAACDTTHRCCTDGEAQLVTHTSAAAADCEVQLTSIVDRGLSVTLDETWLGADVVATLTNVEDLLASRALVRIGFDEDAIAACADWLRDRECRTAVETEQCTAVERDAPAPCLLRRLVQGLVPENAECAYSVHFDECADGLQCSRRQSRCERGAAVGDACRLDCPSPDNALYCDAERGRCERRGDLGDACAFVGGPPQPDGLEALQLARPCLAGLGCDPFSNTCVERCESGTVCSSAADCAEGLACSYAYTSSKGLCLPPQEAGMRCKAATECSTGICLRWSDGINRCFGGAPFGELAGGSECTLDPMGDLEGQVDLACASYWCDSDERCAPGMCNPDAEPSELGACPAGEYCHNVDLATKIDNVLDPDVGFATVAVPSGACREKRPTGLGEASMCASPVDCTSGICAARQCQDATAIGGTCRDDAQCIGGFCDADGTCKTLLGLEASCERDAQCESELFCDAAACAARHDVGAPCTDDAACRSGLACIRVYATDDTSTRQCVDPTDRPVGASCSGDTDSACATGLACYRGRCTAPLADGDDCSNLDGPCLPDSFCRVTSRAAAGEPAAAVCATKPPSGEPCDPRADIIDPQDLSQESPSAQCEGSCRPIDGFEYRCGLAPDYCDGEPD